jgi:hypothetical protein
MNRSSILECEIQSKTEHRAFNQRCKKTIQKAKKEEESEIQSKNEYRAFNHDAS